MHIAIDIDDTLTESFDYFLPYIAEFFHADAGELRQKNISYSTLPDAWKPRELEFNRTYFDRIVPDTPFKADALWGVTALRQQGHKIFIITARSNDFYTDAMKTTGEELRNGGIPYDKLICALDKAAVCREEGIHILIDDLPANCDAAAAAGVTALLFTSKGNRHVESPHRRVASWAEAVEAVAQLVQQQN